MHKLKKVSTLAAMMTALTISTHAAASAVPNAQQLEVRIQKLQAQTQLLQQEVKALQKKGYGASTQQMKRHTATPVSDNKNEHVLRFHGISVTTSPYMGLRSSPDASDMLTMASSVNEDLFLMLQRDRLIVSPAYSYPNAPMIELSGELLGEADFGQGSQVQLSTSELDIEALASPWALGFISINYDNSQRTGIQAADNKLYLDRAFLTIGQTSHNPLYFTAGQMYVPFGVYSSALILSPVTKLFGKTNVAAAQLGFYKHHFNFSAYLFQGRNKIFNDGNQKLNRWGLNVSYVDKTKLGDDTAGISFISTLTDSNHLNGSGLFQTDLSSDKHINKAVPGLDIHTKLNFNKIKFIGEYVLALTNFDHKDFNTNFFSNSHAKNIKPSALDLELGLSNFMIHNWSSNAYLDYQHTSNAAELMLPKDIYAVVLNVSPIKNTVLSAQLSHNTAYSKADQANLTSDSQISDSTVLTLQAGLYF